MSRYTGPKERISRALGLNLFLKGKRYEAGKSAFHKGRGRPGQHGQSRIKVSEYGMRLKEKQKLRFMYGVSEKQFRRYYDFANQSKGSTDERFLQFLETRLDNVVYRMKFATTRAQARQFVSHGHILVNGKRVNVASYKVRANDKIEVLEASKNFVRNAVEGFVGEVVPEWMTSDTEAMTGEVLRTPLLDQIDTGKLIQINLIIEFYSK
ncbi:30S ribosomal protein S4 [bacterium (Candidatus Blackallbacteria) CG17_big_fil_post_rev_8_21_14_2_50_48_46]|uniref:Small ribosomal subunit protein uS4 n=1 Tax=bacterium (Candidatus Blackallbacteria) CG17_big_fil_post_rev_8_21_14_2_50_48_46 TaxID=2014261 RepID=A0A2M7G6W5_9BACT|nr:MAG: 30S ribosomal protein S4 [bacterium (Candidatus Blackallbacteria) CG18_big_fil_WC_8_21_14_2_50_49_26]PIW17775.1 MAG: 30S ribosomal protein S4 [bacterium (Candidatus Blackallbacteria) CG17_big_fil_post_rev_8_21_14_2_50_48_46]PIW47334.1 MAG: 30S ribosomal protein S4 [bacterium (Candidatus Blackallbacteria) CG13_big_fil_rev_8_21_14_2_50_49_14]